LIEKTLRTREVLLVREEMEKGREGRRRKGDAFFCG
jgi:hypothetical protein